MARVPGRPIEARKLALEAIKKRERETEKAKEKSWELGCERGMGMRQNEVE